MRRINLPLRLACVLAAIACVPGVAASEADPPPEVQRGPFPAQADGVVVTLRIIPEACMRLEGRFAGDRGHPYALSAQPSSARCLPRARLVDAASARPSSRRGWILNDRIQIPSADCLGQVAVVSIWREAHATSVPQRDAQGRVRLYLHDAMQQAGNSLSATQPRYSAQVTVQGPACRN